MNRATNPPAPHVEEFRIYPEDAPAVNPGGWVGCWRLLCPKYTTVTQRVKGCAAVVIPDALTIRYYDVEADGWRSFKVENFVTVY